MVGKGQSRYGRLDPFCAELLAAKEGLLFAWELRFRRVILESDAQLVYFSIRDPKEDHYYNSAILRDISLYASCFDCNFVSRLCNRVANELAHLNSSRIDHIWIQNPPEEILQLLFVIV